MKMEVEEVAGAEAVALITASKLYICFISIFGGQLLAVMLFLVAIWQEEEKAV